MDRAAQTFIADQWDEAWEKGLWAASWKASVEGLTAAQAAWSPGPDRHSIWQIVMHLVFWRDNLLRRITTGVRPTEDEVARLNFPRPTEATEAAWSEARRRLADSQARVSAALRSGDPAHGALAPLLAHDSYHVGQINYVRALQGLKPIE